MDLLDPFPTYIYKACLLYTVEHKLAPQWNKVGQYLVEGQDFLSSTGNVNAITLNIKDVRGTSPAFKQLTALDMSYKLSRIHGDVQMSL